MSPFFHSPPPDNFPPEEPKTDPELGGADRIIWDRCPFCQQKINLCDFRDRLSLQEYRVSGRCMACQDKLYGD
jgi:hypothetical protein